MPKNAAAFIVAEADKLIAMLHKIATENVYLKGLNEIKKSEAPRDVRDTAEAVVQALVPTIKNITEELKKAPKSGLSPIKSVVTELKRCVDRIQDQDTSHTGKRRTKKKRTLSAQRQPEPEQRARSDGKTPLPERKSYTLLRQRTSGSLWKGVGLRKRSSRLDQGISQPETKSPS